MVAAIVTIFEQKKTDFNPVIMQQEIFTELTEMKTMKLFLMILHFFFLLFARQLLNNGDVHCEQCF